MKHPLFTAVSVSPRPVTVMRQSHMLKSLGSMGTPMTMDPLYESEQVSSKVGLTVLIIDDDKSVLQILSKILQKGGYSVETAETGQEALNKLEPHNYAAALIDVKLQDMNGLDLLKRIHQIAPNMTKIILTGYPSNENKTRALQLGADEYLEKPVKAEKLIETLQTKLAKQTNIKENQNPTQNTIQKPEKTPRNDVQAVDVTRFQPDDDIHTAFSRSTHLQHR